MILSTKKVKKGQVAFFLWCNESKPSRAEVIWFQDFESSNFEVRTKIEVEIKIVDEVKIVCSWGQNCTLGQKCSWGQNCS